MFNKISLLLPIEDTDMKEVKAIIQPFRLHSVIAGLNELGDLPGMTVSEISSYSITNIDADPRVKLKIEIMVPDEMEDAVVETIQKFAHTGNPGDGRIFVIDIHKTIKIRTGEIGTAD